MSRARSGDGHTPTNALAPCCCPSCGGELIVTCANACPDAADGASGHVDPIARTLPPRTEEQPARHRTRRERPKHFCARCTRELPPSKGRPRKFCDGCETPAERKDRLYKLEWNRKNAA